MAIDNDGNIFINDYRDPGTGSGRIHWFKPNGERVVINSNLYYQDGIAVLPNGNLLVSPDALYEVTRDGVVSLYLTGLSYPGHMEPDGIGNLYISEGGAGRITILHPDKSTETFASGLNNPNGTTFDDQGHLWVTEHFLGSVVELDSTGQKIREISGFPPYGPSSIEFWDGSLFVGNTIDASIYRVEKDGSWNYFATGFTGKANPPFTGPGVGLAVGNILYIIDADNLWKIQPVTEEVCDGIDNNGDNQIDEGFPAGNTSCGHDVAVTPNGETVTFGSVTSSGNTTVTLSNSGPTAPSGYTLGRTPSYHDITTTAAFSGMAKVCIAYDATNFTTERALRLLHHNGIRWDDITTTLDTTANIICGVTTSFSPFIVAQQASTAVTLSNLSAKADGDNVSLTWSTRSETDNEGFVVLRSEYQNGPFSPVSSMIPAAGGPGMTATYNFTDSNVGQGKTYYYRLQDVDSRGIVTTHNVIPVTTVVAGGEKLFQKIQDQKQGMQGIPHEIGQEIIKKSGRDSVVEAEFPPTLILPRKGGGDNDAADNAFPHGEGNLDEAVQPNANSVTENRPEKVIVPSVDHIVTASSNLAEGRQKQSLDINVNESSVRASAYASSSFSVTIEDEIGNLISISKMNNALNSDASANELDVKEDTGKVVLTWQAVKPVKGFVIYRAEKGKKEYSPITSLIPYFEIGEKDVLQYRFIDNGVKPGVKYDYHIKVVDSSNIAGKKPA